MKPKILVYRTIGGLGDALTCTPGLIDFVKRNQSIMDITIAFPGFTLPMFKNTLNVKDIKLIDKNKFGDKLSLGEPCPAAAYESTHMKNTRLSRIQLFAAALGFDPKAYVNTVPVYNLTQAELEYLKILQMGTKGFRIGIAVNSAETYKDYGKINELIEKLTKLEGVDYLFLMGTRLPEGYKPNSKHRLFIKKDLRRTIAAQALCNAFVTQDSLFLHTAAALGIPTVLVEGPLSNDFRYQSYPILRVRGNQECIPCWRNSGLPCIHLPLEIEKSLCMQTIEPEVIISALGNYDKSGRIHN